METHDYVSPRWEHATGLYVNFILHENGGIILRD